MTKNLNHAHGGDLDAITGATISTRAVVNGVNAVLACIANLG